MKPRTITWLLLTGLLTFLLVQVYWRKPVSGTPKTRRPAAIIPPGNRRPPLHVAPPAAATMPSASEPAPCVPANPGELKFADDAASKHGAFWLEQPLEWTGAPNAHLFDLYLALDQQTQSGLRVRLKGDELALEQGGTAALAAAKVSAHASLARPLTGSTVLGVLWSRGELSAWLGAQEVLHWKPEDTSGTGRRDAGAPSFNGPSAVHVFSPGLRLGAGRTLDLGAIHFDDTFMRNTADGAWSPFSGKWELTGMAFPERSANPFSLRASFGFEQPVDDKLYAGRTHAQDYGLGIMISGYEGTLHVCRITGGGPAARAGLGEDDIFLSIDGISVDNFDHHQLMALLLGRFGAEVRLRMLRPGEGQPREVCITREHFKWGTPAEGIPIPPVREPGQLGADEVALIAAGEAGWSNYAAEVAVKPLGSGGMGLAIAVLSPQDYLLFRWRGPDWQRTVPAGQPVATPPGKLPPFSLPLQKGEAGAGRPGTDRLQLVRVSGGKETVLQELAAGYRPYEFYRLAMDWSGDAVACSVDGNQVFAASVPDLKRGQIALYALKGDPVFFDDVRVYADRKALAAAHHPEQMVNQIFANEEDMQVWANPAQEWDRDLKTGWAVHKARFPGEQAVVLNKPRFTELTVALDCSDDPEKSWGQFSIKDGLACLRGFNCQSADAQVGRGPFQRIVVRNAERAEADVDGVRLSPPVDKSPKKLPAFRGDSIAIRGLKNLGDPNAVHVSSSNVLEYTFDAAPVDWKVACGRWGLLNKWICDPRWSWFGGRTKSLAALWNKFVFSGDITVDGHVALMMQQEDPPYERPGDYNIAICGDGVNLDSGYTLVFAGDNNSWTRLYRKGKMVAESTQEEHRLFSDKIHHPDKPQLHQRWFHLKLEKRGPTVSFYRDDALAFSFTDPEPLQEGRVAFWTLDNGFLLSRVRIAHETLKPGPFEPRRANLYDDGRVINMFDGEVYTAVAPQALPGAIQAALAAPPNAFQPADADVVQASSPASVGQASSPADRAAIPAYRVLNTIGGGPFALQWKNLSVDAEARSVLRFAYCIEPGANVDLYLLDISTNRPFDPRRNGAYRVRLTGPRESDEFTPLAGEIPNVKADGRWHAVQYDLNPSWRALWQQRGYKRPRTYPVLRPMIGNLANQGYLLAGLNGNHAGAAYSISDIQTFSPRETSSAAPSVQSVIWPFDPAGDGRSVAVVFGGGGSAGIMDESLQAELNGVAVPRELVAFDHLRQTLRVDLAGFNLPPLPAAPKLNLKLPVFQDRARNFSAGPFSASYTFDPEKALQAAKPAAAPVVTFEFAGGGDVVPSGTALRLSEVSPLSPIARLQESSDAPPWAPYGRQRSLQVVNINDGSAFGFALNNLAYNLRRWPYLLLEYKMPLETPVNLHFYDQAGALHALLLGDTGDAQDPESQDIASRAGPPADFVCDGTWHSTLVPLQRCFSGSLPQAGFAALRGFSLHDHGWRGSRRAMQYWVHRVQPVPAGRTADFKFFWQATDITGISDYAACLDQDPQTDPQGKQELASGQTLDAALAKRGAGLKDGWNYLHVRVKNGAGVWSAPTHTRFMLDNTPPQVLRTEPRVDSVYAGQTVSIFFNEEHGIDLTALRLSINGQLVPGWQSLRFDPARNCITCNALAAGVRWPERGKVSVELQGLKDLLGNQAAAPFTFSFTADKGAAWLGPAITQMRFTAPAYMEPDNRQMDMETSFSLDFEEHTGHVRALRDCRMEWLDDPALACFGRRAVRFTALDDDADVQIMLHKNPWYLDRGPLLQFDYKAEAGLCVDILVEVLDKWSSIRFTGAGAAPEGGKAIGRVEAVVADGTWRHASVDLKSLIDTAWPNLEVRIVNKVILSAQGRPGCKRGSSLVLDNLELSRPMMTGGRFEWQAEASPSGLAGYSFVFDQNAATVPPERFAETGNTAAAGSRTGVWYAHVRACDQAGNWGPARTMRVDFGE